MVQKIDLDVVQLETQGTDRAVQQSHLGPLRSSDLQEALRVEAAHREEVDVDRTAMTPKRRARDVPRPREMARRPDHPPLRAGCRAAQGRPLYRACRRRIQRRRKFRSRSWISSVGSSSLSSSEPTASSMTSQSSQVPRSSTRCSSHRRCSSQRTVAGHVPEQNRRKP